MFSKIATLKESGGRVNINITHFAQEEADRFHELSGRLKEEGVELVDARVKLVTECFGIAAQIMREIKHELHRKWNLQAMAEAGVTGREGC